MLRSLVLPAACAALLAGCVTGYGYRADRGDYYYGHPEVEYRHHGSPWGGGWGRPGYHGGYYDRYYGPYRRWPGYGYYGHPHRGYGYWGWPHTPRYVIHPRPPHVVQPPGGGGGGVPGTPVDRGDNRGSPWRNLDELRRRREGVEIARQVEPSMPQRIDAPRPEMPRMRRDDSGLGGILREARERRAEPRDLPSPEQEP